MKPRKFLSQRHPLLYFLAVWSRRMLRYGAWYCDSKTYARKRTTEKLAFRIKKHQSVLLKKLGESDMQWQINKVVNLKIAARKISGILIRPRETFSSADWSVCPRAERVIWRGWNCRLARRGRASAAASARCPTSSIGW
ncbi:MAG: VanW family protein [Zoogloeaceae bacterium]|jgi:hypothetical protein|nr:VanW family protein [Zoogloeaceae bacterium]